MLLHDSLDFFARERADRLCIACGDRTLLYGEAHAHINRLAQALVSAGLAPGDRFAVLAKNCLEYPLFYYAGSKSGAAPVPLNYRLAPPELAYIVADSGARLVIARAELVEQIDAVRGELGNVKTWVSLDGPRPDGWIDYGEWLAQQPAGVAVIGVPDEKWGESVKAILVLRADLEASAEDLVAFCKGRLAGYKCPRSVDFVSELPRNASGKVLKKELREQYWQGHDRRVS